MQPNGLNLFWIPKSLSKKRDSSRVRLKRLLEVARLDSPVQLFCWQNARIDSHLIGLSRDRYSLLRLISGQNGSTLSTDLVRLMNFIQAYYHGSRFQRQLLADLPMHLLHYSLPYNLLTTSSQSAHTNIRLTCKSGPKGLARFLHCCSCKKRDKGFIRLKRLLVVAR